MTRIAAVLKDHMSSSTRAQCKFLTFSSLDATSWQQKNTINNIRKYYNSFTYFREMFL